MKIIIISLLLFFTVNAQTVWYVDQNAPTSTQDGTSWATAWKHFDVLGGGYNSPDWTSIGDGDTIYISGGTDSLVYIPFFEGQPHYFGNSTVSKTFGTQVVICPAREAGRADWADYNGKVIFADTSTQSTQAIVTFGGYLDNVKLYGVTVTDYRPSGSSSLPLFGMYGDDIVFESDTLLTAGQNSGGGFGGTRCVLRNCVYIEPPNETTTASDFIGQWNDKGGGIIEGCKIFIENNYTMISGDGNGMTVTDTSLTDTDLTGANAMQTDYHVGIAVIVGNAQLEVTSNDSNTFYGTGGWTWGGSPVATPSNGTAWTMEGVHRDIIQYSVLDNWVDGENFENIVRNNLIVDQGTRGTGWNSMVYTSNPGADIRWLIYNNVFANREEISSGGIFLYGSVDTFDMSIRFFNNTIITKGDGHQAWDADAGVWYYDTSIPVSFGNMDTIYFKNNIVIVDTSHKAYVNLESNGYTVFDNNIYADRYGVDGYGYNPESFAYDGLVRTWDNWVAQGYDVTNSDTMYAGNITFTNKFGRNITDYYTTTGRDLGSDLTDMPDYAGIVSRHPDILKDILGNNRGSNGAWDIGSLEWQGDVTDTIPTYTFTATTNVELNSYNIRSAVFANADSIFTVWTETADSFKVGALSSYDIIEVEAEAGDTVFITNIASGLYETETLSYIRAGGNTQSYSVTTKSEPVVPVTGNKILKGNNGLIMKDRNGKIIRTLQ